MRWVLGLGVLIAGPVSCGGNEDPEGSNGLPAAIASTPVDQIGEWDDGSQTFTKTFHVRPPGGTVRNNVFKDAINVFVSLQTVQDVHIYGNVFVGTLADWDVWNSIHSSEPMQNVFIYNNTFYGLTGLSTGFRFTGDTNNVVVKNNL